MVPGVYSLPVYVELQVYWSCSSLSKTRTQPSYSSTITTWIQHKLVCVKKYTNKQMWKVAPFYF